MMRLHAVLLGVAACSFTPGATTSTGDDEMTSDARRPSDGSIDAPADAAIDARVCPAAPAGCTLFSCAGSASCYYACGAGTLKASWNGAAQSCVNGNLGCLVTINDQAEQDCVVAAALPAFPNIVWFGYHQTSTSNEPAGNWSWECGTSNYVQTGWGNPAGEPNDQGGDEDCAAMTTGGGWFDATCSGTARYVCELP